MAISITENQISGGTASAASITLNFTGQPPSGALWVVDGGCWFMEGGSSLSISAPASLTNLITADSQNPELGQILSYKDSSGSDGTASTVAKSGTTRPMAAVALEIDGAEAPNAYGSNSPTADGTAISVTTNAGADSGNVTANNSLAVFVVLRRARAETLTDVTYSNSFTELAKGQSSTDSRTEIYVATKTVNSGSTVTCQWESVASTAAGLQAFLFVMPPSNSAPTVTAAATDDCVVGVNENIGSVFTVADTDSNLDTIRYQCAEAHGDITVTLSGGVTVSAGTNGTHDLTITGSHSALLTVHATAVFTATTEDTQNITVTATDDDAETANDTVAMTSHFMRITGASQAGLNTTLGTGTVTNSQAESTMIDFLVVDSGGRTGSASTTVTTTVPTYSTGFVPNAIDVGIHL